MKKNNFYNHLIEFESVYVELDSMDLSDAEKKHLAEIIDSNLHHTVLNAILSELSEEDKEKFLSNLGEGDHERIWIHLNDKTDNIEEKIKTAAEGLKKEIHQDLKESKKLKES